MQIRNFNMIMHTCSCEQLYVDMVEVRVGINVIIIMKVISIFFTHSEMVECLS